jgi:hypothetical protein
MQWKVLTVENINGEKSTFQSLTVLFPIGPELRMVFKINVKSYLSSITVSSDIGFHITVVFFIKLNRYFLYGCLWFF